MALFSFTHHKVAQESFIPSEIQSMAAERRASGAANAPAKNKKPGGDGRGAARAVAAARPRANAPQQGRRRRGPPTVTARKRIDEQLKRIENSSGSKYKIAMEWRAHKRAAISI